MEFIKVVLHDLRELGFVDYDYETEKYTSNDLGRIAWREHTAHTAIGLAIGTDDSCWFCSDNSELQIIKESIWVVVDESSK